MAGLPRLMATIPSIGRDYTSLYSSRRGFRAGLAVLGEALEASPHIHSRARFRSPPISIVIGTTS